MLYFKKLLSDAPLPPQSASKRLMYPAGIEPATFCLPSKYVNLNILEPLDAFPMQVCWSFELHVPFLVV